jgi:hypothetical protein
MDLSLEALGCLAEFKFSSAAPMIDQGRNNHGLMDNFIAERPTTWTLTQATGAGLYFPKESGGIISWRAISKKPAHLFHEPRHLQQ